MSTLDPTIVAVSDPSIITFGAIESPLPIVTIPEGQTQSNPFLVSGLQVGKTVLNALTSNPEFPGFPTPIGTWDVNPGADANSTKFLDANPADGPTNCRVSGSAVLSTDPAVLSSCGQPVIGTVTDGASQLLMRLVSGLTGTACYELVSSGPDFPDQGMIPNPVVGTQTVGGLNYAFSFYQAPDVYGDTTGMSRQVQVQFVFTPDSGNGDTTSITANLTVVRPPMMLIHGVWGSAGTWDPMIFITNAPSKVFNADYSSTNGASFTTNLPKIQGFVANTLMLSHQAGYAATKADVVAHSMGGILTRLYAASPQYMRPDNFNRG